MSKSNNNNNNNPPPEIYMIESDEDDYKVDSITTIHKKNDNDDNFLTSLNGTGSKPSSSQSTSPIIIGVGNNNKEERQQNDKEMKQTGNINYDHDGIISNPNQHKGTNCNNNYGKVGNGVNGIDIDEYDNDDEREQSPMTHLPQPDYERQFRTSIIKPLQYILDSNTQEQTLSMVRMNFFIVLQGLFLEAKGIYHKKNDHNSTTMGTTVASARSERDCNMDIDHHNFHYDPDYDPNLLTAPGLYLPNNQINVYYGYQITQCTFADPDSESITKKKLIPMVIKMLLKLGDGGGDRKSTFGESYLSVIAEDLIVSILLDFVGMVCKILSLVDNVNYGDNCDNHNEKEEGGGEEENVKIGNDNRCNSSSKKRRRIEKTQNELSSSSELLPNILDFIGDDILMAFTKVLASEACSQGYNQSLRLLRLEDKNRAATVEDVVHSYLPSFFKSHSLFEDYENNTIDSMKNEYLSPLRSGEWKMYFSLYHAEKDLNPSSIIQQQKQQQQQQQQQDRLGLKSIMNSPDSLESRDAPSTSTKSSISRHLIAIARYFVNNKGLDYLNRLVASGFEQNKQMLPVNVTNFQHVMAIYHSISFISSFCCSSADTTTDSLHISSTMINMVQFKSTLKMYFHSILLGIQHLSQGEQRIILEILGSIEERSLSDDECTYLCNCLGSVSTANSANIAPYIDLTTSDSAEMKLTILWKLFTGRIEEDGDPNDLPVPVSPSLQCQILALNEIVHWLKHLESLVKECRDNYDDIRANNDVSKPAKSTNDYLHDLPPLVPNNEVVKNEYVDLNENESTEVCCHSNDSISSTNTDADINSKLYKKNEKYGGSDIEFDARGTFSLDIVHSTEERLVAVLHLLKTKFNIVGHLFSSHGLHSEILKRSLPLLEIFARNKKITEEDIKLMWDVTGFSTCETLVNSHVHVSVTSAIFELMLGLLNTNWVALGSNVVSYFGKLFQEVTDQSRWTRNSLYLVETVALRSIDLMVYESLQSRIENDIQIPVGIDLLWRLSQVMSFDTYSTTSKESFDTVVGSLIRIFENVMEKCTPRNDGNVEPGVNSNQMKFQFQENKVREKMKKIQTYIIRRAIDSMESSSECLNKSVNIRFLHYLVVHLPVTRSRAGHSDNMYSQDELLLSIEDVVNSCNLVSIITNEMKSYMTIVKQKMCDEKELDWDSQILVSGMYTHRECVFYRQQLFQTFVTKCFELVELKSDSSNRNGLFNGKRKRIDYSQITNLVEDEADGGDSNAFSPDKRNDDKSITIDHSMTQLLPSRHQVTEIWVNYVSNCDSYFTAECIITMFYSLLTTESAEKSSALAVFQWRQEMVKTLYPLCCCLNETTISIAGYQLLIYCLGHINALEETFQTIPFNPIEKHVDIEAKLPMMSNILLGISHDFDKKVMCISSLHLRSESLITKISKYNISGLDFLWSIILECIDENVANMAMVYIAVLYTFPLSISGEKFSETASEQVNFVRKCIMELKTQNELSSNIKRQIRLLHLLKLFVQNSNYSSSTFPSHGSLAQKINTLQVGNIIGVSLPFSVYIQVINGPKFSIYCPLGKNTRIAFVRNEIATYICSNLSQDFRLIYAGYELKDNATTFETHGVKAHSFIFCCPRLSTKHLKMNESIHVVEPVVEECRNKKTQNNFVELKTIPYKKIPISKKSHDEFLESKHEKQLTIPGISELLSNGSIDFLFSLLSYENNYDEKKVWQSRALVWDLLQSLPTEPILQAGIDSLLLGNRTILLSQLLPTPDDRGDFKCMLFRLLYSLQAVERAITPLNICASDDATKNIKVTDVPKNSEKKENGNESIRNNNNIAAQASETSAVFVIDEDDVDNINIASKNDVDSGKFERDDDIESIQFVKNFLSHDGLQHLVDTFLSLGDIYFDHQYQDTHSDHEISSLVITCSNKLIFLITSLTVKYGVFRSDPRISLVSSSECSPLFTLLLKVIHWAITFQLMSSNDESNSSKYISGGWSSAEIGGALACQCVTMIRIMATQDLQKKDHVRFIKPGDTTILLNAISSSIVISPSKIVRSESLPIFKQLLALYERECKKGFYSKSNSNDSSMRFYTPSLSVLIMLVPVGRKFVAKERNIYGEVSSRCTLIFDMLIDYISNLWTQLSHESKDKVLEIFIEKTRSLPIDTFSHSSLSDPPDIEGVDEIWKILVWIFQEFKLLIKMDNQQDFSQYIAGLLSLAKSIIMLFVPAHVNTIIGSIQMSLRQNLLQLLCESAMFYRKKCNGREEFRFLTTDVRKQIMDLILSLCKSSQQNLELILNSTLSDFYSSKPRKDVLKDWAIDPLLKQKNIAGHVGMKNQGATCYLNSLLQQFFHIPHLCLGLLSCKVETENELSEDHRLLFELQRLFGNLLLSEKRDVTTVDLTKCIRGYDGSSIRPGEQQDVDEFFNLFCDRLETALKDFPEKRLLHDVFGGQLSHIITCQECQLSSERTEDFLSISIDVKGKHNIFESLQSYIRGEVLDGSNKYLCSKCETKTDSIKRCCIKTLPNVLICHLKRFDFDLEMLRKVKVNDRFEYPTELDMKNFTKEGLGNVDNPDLSWRGKDYYKYTLRGVLVHTGTADSGHYYSLSRVHNYDTAQFNCNGDRGTWFCFNDSVVSSFDPSTLEISTFGGTHEHNSGGQSKKNDFPKSYSAYLLIYDRKDCYKFDDQIAGTPKMTQISPHDLDLNSDWAKGISEANLRHAIDQIIFSPDYGNFILEICKNTFGDEKLSPSQSLCAKVLTFHLLENLVHVRDRIQEIGNAFSILSSWYQNCESSCRWLLQLMTDSHKHWVEKILLHCSKVEVKKMFVNLMGVIFHKLAPGERADYYNSNSFPEITSEIQNQADAFDSDGEITITYNYADDATVTLPRFPYWRSISSLVSFVGTLLDILDEAELHWKLYDHVFECLSRFACLGQDEAILLIRCGTILRLVNIYNGQEGGIPPQLIVRPPQKPSMRNDSKSRINSKNKRLNSFPLLNLLSVLIRSGNCRDDDLDVSDSDSSIEDQCDISPTKSKIIYSNIYLTKHCGKSHESDGASFELPRRDTYFVSRDEILKSLLSEISYHDIKNDQLVSENNIIDIVCNITCHLCFNNLFVTFRICSLAKRIIQDRKAHESITAVKVLTSLIYLEDKYTDQRIQGVISSIFDGIKANSEYEKELLFLLDALNDELLNRTPGPRGLSCEVRFHEIILEKLDSIVSLFGQNISNNTKCKILALVNSLLPIDKRPIGNNNDSAENIILQAYEGFSLQSNSSCSLPQRKKHLKECDTLVDYRDDAVVKGKIFRSLKDLHMTISDAISSYCSEARGYGMTHGILNYSQVMESAKYHEYFAILRKCLDCKGLLENDDNWIHDITRYLMPVFWKVDNDDRHYRRCYADILKGEMIRFLETLAILDLNEFLRAFLDVGMQISSDNHDNDPITKFMEVFVTSSNNSTYNEHYTSHYYNLLAFLAKKDKQFNKVVLDHENWRWALKTFVFNSTSARPGRLYDILLTNTLMFVKESDKVRKAIFNGLFFCNGTYSFLDEREFDEAALQLLQTIIESEHLCYEQKSANLCCILKFTSGKNSGMSKISFITKKLFSEISMLEKNTRSSTQEKVMLTNLHYCVDIMHFIFSSLQSRGEIERLRDSWPEADEINSIFVQIITKPEEEWEIIYQQDQAAKNRVAGFVKRCQELHRLLLSIQSNDERNSM